MKKLLMLLVMAVSFSLIGIGGANTAKAAETLNVGSSVDFPPFEFKDDSHREYQGFDMDLIRAIAKELGMDTNIIKIDFDSLIPEVQKNNIDVAIAALTINGERSQKVNFSDSYFKSGLKIIVQKNNYRIKNLKNLEGKKIAVQGGTTAAETVRTIANANITEVVDATDAYTLLRYGFVDAVIDDGPIADYFVTNHSNFGIKSLPNMLTAENYGIAVSKDNTKLLNQINAALKKLRDNGEYNKIYRKWFGN